MKVRTHFHLAKLSLKNIKDNYPKNFSAKMFYLGTIIADCCWLPYTNPHFQKKSQEYVQKKLDNIIKRGKFNAYNSLQFGIIIHYLCDFCCHSHITGGIGNAVDHVVYERKIQKYLLNNISKLSNKIKAKNIKNTIELKTMIDNQIEKYKNGIHSYMWDIENSIQVTTDICAYVFKSFNKKLHPAFVPVYVKKK